MPRPRARRARRACRCSCRGSARGDRCRARCGPLRDRVRARVALVGVVELDDHVCFSSRRRRRTGSRSGRRPTCPEPKSGWRPVPAPIVAMIASEFDATGSESTRMFHGLSAGNIGAAAPAGEHGRRRRAPAPRRRSRAPSQLLQERVGPVEQHQVACAPAPTGSERPALRRRRRRVRRGPRYRSASVARGTHLEGVILVLRRPGRPAELANGPDRPRCPPPRRAPAGGTARASRRDRARPAGTCVPAAGSSRWSKTSSSFAPSRSRVTYARTRCLTSWL